MPRNTHHFLSVLFGRTSTVLEQNLQAKRDVMGGVWGSATILISWASQQRGAAWFIQWTQEISTKRFLHMARHDEGLGQNHVRHGGA